MPSLCQAEWETSSQERENDCQMVEEKEASDMGDGGGEEKAEGETDQEGDKKDGGGAWGEVPRRPLSQRPSSCSPRPTGQRSSKSGRPNRMKSRSRS